MINTLYHCKQSGSFILCLPAFFSVIKKTASLEWLGSNWKKPGPKTIKKNTNSTPNKSQTHCARAYDYEVTSFLSRDCELSTETCSTKVYSLGPRALAQFSQATKSEELFPISSEYNTIWSQEPTFFTFLCYSAFYRNQQAVLYL